MTTQRINKAHIPSITIEILREHLQTAIQLEHATIPAYLTALYSIKEGTNREAALVIRSVVIEEMLHMTLAANVLNAVGGEPSINSKEFVPGYPTRLPHSCALLEVQLERLSKDAIGRFMRIEHPPYSTDAKPQQDQWSTIGQFYEAIIEVIGNLCPTDAEEKKVFSGDIERQVTPEQYYGSGGGIVVVHNKKTAIDALKIIIEQGEGADHTIWEERSRAGCCEDVMVQKKVGANWEEERVASKKQSSKLGRRDEVAHFFKFDELRKERYYRPGDNQGAQTGHLLPIDWDAVWPIHPNSKSTDFPAGTEIRTMLEEFNRSYKNFLNVLHKTFNGEPGLIAKSVPQMYDLGYKAQEICRTPIPGTQETVGPSWEWVPD